MEYVMKWLKDNNIDLTGVDAIVGRGGACYPIEGGTYEVDDRLINDVREAKGGGLLLFPNTYKDIRQIDVKPYTIDAEQMKLIDKNIYEYFGTNEDVLQNKAHGESLEGFFDGAIEPFAIQFSEAVTKMLFSERERAQGSYFIANANRLQYMSVSQKVQMAKELGDRGAILIDEIRELFNYGPLPDGSGQVAPIRGESNQGRI